jgi:hypothetical protein
MPKNPNTITKHLFSIFATIVLITIFSCASTYINLIIKYGPNPGPYADMAGLGFVIFFCGFLFLLFFLLILIGIVSEFGKKVFQGKLNQWVSTPLMFMFFAGTSLLILSLLETFFVHDKFSLFLWFTPALDTSIKIGVIGVVYRLMLYIFDVKFAKDNVASQETNKSD